MKCRILESNECIVTSNYGARILNGKNNNHYGIDVVKEGYQLDYIVAHSDGIVNTLVDNKSNSKGNGSYGNYVIIKHKNNYSTLYAHMKKGLLVKSGDSVKQGQRIGFMGDSGDAYGAHLHFEVRKNNKRIDPTKYLDSDFEMNQNINNNLYKIGDVVQIDGVYVSSTSKIKLKPKITEGIITHIIEGVNNPYLLDNGYIGWINDDCIVKEKSKYLSNKKYKGNSIVDALKQININSSYANRKEIAEKNGIVDYKGTRKQNILMLNLLKSGILKY